jgi:GNAT superfamily N-acetyltransferase
LGVTGGDDRFRLSHRFLFCKNQRVVDFVSDRRRCSASPANGRVQSNGESISTETYLNPTKRNIRQAATGDLERIVRLFAQLEYATNTEQVKQQLLELRRNALGEAFVAEDRGNIVGVAIVHTVKPLHVQACWALLSALVVDADGRSAGVGKSLLTAAEGFALQHGCSQIELSSSSVRTRAHRFYEQNGYEEKRLRFVKIFI